MRKSTVTSLFTVMLLTASLSACTGMTTKQRNIAVGAAVGGVGGNLFVVARAADGGQRVGNAHFGVALRHADAGFAEIEGQRGAVWDIKHGRRFG